MPCQSKKAKRPSAGRPRREIADETLKIILSLTSTGFSDLAVAKVVQIKPDRWKRFAAEHRKIKIGDKTQDFGLLWEKAKLNRNGGLAGRIAQVMLKKIDEGHPWYVKLALHNFNTGFKDPDVVAAVKTKKALDAMDNRAPNASEFIQPNFDLAQVVMPSGVIPSALDPDDAIANSTINPAVDGDEAAPGPETPLA